MARHESATPATPGTDPIGRHRPRARTAPPPGALALALALVIAPGPSGADTVDVSPAPAHLQGLIDLPRLAGLPDVRDDGVVAPLRDLVAPPSAMLLGTPAMGVGVVLAEVGLDALVTAPSGPGTVGAMVFDVAGPADDPWYLLARREGERVIGHGWYRPAPGERMRPYDRLLTDGLAFMRNGWDGRLYATPADPVAHRVIPPSGGGAIRVADAWMDDDPAASWLLIVVFVEDSVCGEGWPVVVASGWVRAYRDDAGPAAWFHTDDC